MPSVLVALALLVLTAPTRAAVHPKDGPDIDLRLSIADGSVRVHLTMNLAFVDEIVEVPREDPTQLHPVEYPALEAALHERLPALLDLTVDGQLVEPDLGAFRVSTDALQLLPLFPTFGSRALIQITQVLEVTTAEPADAVELAWHAYPADATLALATGIPVEDAPPIEIEGRLLVGPRDDPLPLRAHEPRFLWTRATAGAAPGLAEVPAPPGPEDTAPPGLPVPALACAVVGLLALASRRPSDLRARILLSGVTGVLAVGLWPLAWGRVPLGSGRDPGLPDAAQARAIFEPLHANIYRAFDHTVPSDVYDALAVSVGGDLLPRLYDRVYRGLVMQDHDGAVARVQEVRPVETLLEDARRGPGGAATFDVRARWQVDGIVRHWGHSHARTHEYAARYTVRADPDGWRLVADEVLEERQLAATPLTPGAASPPAWQPGEEL